MKLIDLYKEWMKTAKLSNCGLCFSIPLQYQHSFELFYPTESDFDELVESGLYERAYIEYDNYGYWAADVPATEPGRHKSFNPIRQTIVLLICAIHNEL